MAVPINRATIIGTMALGITGMWANGKNTTRSPGTANPFEPVRVDDHGSGSYSRSTAPTFSARHGVAGIGRVAKARGLAVQACYYAKLARGWCGRI